MVVGAELEMDQSLDGRSKAGDIVGMYLDGLSTNGMSCSDRKCSSSSSSCAAVCHFARLCP